MNGRFELAGLLPGQYLVELSAWDPPRSTPKPMDVTLPEGQDVEGLRIELPAAGEVRGTVRDAKGQPVRGASVALTGGKDRFGVSAADDGTFRIENVGVGEYRAEVQKGWEKLRAPGTSDDDVQGEKVEVRADAVVTVNLVVASASGKFREWCATNTERRWRTHSSGRRARRSARARPRAWRHARRGGRSASSPT
ncbi:carboxypeptidase regulatory-like domain-containing protein [Nannocystis pusilla]|uniref:carboxypeptidase-like regulatory domain-containing protein n=1 Tax=Nannocystis pusilla TaxID=889268 RepID=UPI003B808EF9